MRTIRLFQPLSFSALLMTAIPLTANLAQAETIKIDRMQYSGPIAMPQPLTLGDTSVLKSIPIDSYANILDEAPMVNIDGVMPSVGNDAALQVFAFNFENRSFVEAQIDINGSQPLEVTIDGKKHSNGKLKLHPGTHKAVIKHYAEPGKTDSLSATIETKAEGVLKIVEDGTRMFTLEDVLYGTRISGASVSPSGKYVIANYSDIKADGSSTARQRLYNSKTGALMATMHENANWMPRSDKYYVERNNYEYGRHLVAINPETGAEEVFAKNLPKGAMQLSPTEDFLLFHLVREGEAEDPNIYQVLEPEDRQPGWRSRSYPAIMPLQGGALRPLTTGSTKCWATDISPDGKRVLLMSSRSRLEKRPTTVMSLLELDLSTMKADTLALDDGFLSNAVYSPKGDKVLAMGTPEAFDRIGCVLDDNTIPSMVQQELFIIDLNDKKVTPISREFDPNPQDMVWNAQDGNIYIRAEKRDMYAIYKYDVNTQKYVELDLPENIVKGFDLSLNVPVMAWWGQSDSNPDALYVMNLNKGTNTVLDRPSEQRLRNVRLAKCQDWNFENSRGDIIYGRFYLPDNFDPDKKYPLIVNYYGGCSPTQRLFESRYPHHVYSELGYVVYVLQPSGATGFGQEFSSRHVNTAGQGPAEDIIEGTKKFVAEHPYVNSDKIGCIGASYGGFMTQYLQTVTDIYAAAISHAGISDHTSYWGEGWWGYSYSETSMAESYPWTRPDLYVNQSPLFNADKVNTPILFVHGDQDINVPVGESIQMFTALKLLGKETALVQVEGQSHHIIDFEKRKKWQDTIFAWFAKYLQDDSTWWDSIYSPKGL